MLAYKNTHLDSQCSYRDSSEGAQSVMACKMFLGSVCILVLGVFLGGEIVACGRYEGGSCVIKSYYSKKDVDSNFDVSYVLIFNHFFLYFIFLIKIRLINLLIQR